VPSITYKSIIPALALTTLILSGCAPTISLAVRHPPALNTSGIKRIAIMPFEYSYSGGDCHDATHYNLGFIAFKASDRGEGCGEIAQYATIVATDKIREQNYFTLVDPAEIDRLQRNNQSVESYADAVFKGQITGAKSWEESEEESREKKNGETEYYTVYKTNVEIDFSYSLTRTRDGSLIGPIYKKGRSSASSNDNYPSASELMKKVINHYLGDLGRDLAPHTVIEHRGLASEKSRDKLLKAEMKEAATLVKAGNYKPALESYLRIFDRYKSVAAAENASILHEYFGDVEAAANLMYRALNLTGNPGPRAIRALERLNKIRRDQATLANEYDDRSSRTAKIAAFAGAEIQRALPEKAVVWIYNNSPDNAMAGAVIDDITAGFIKKGIELVDRELQSAALIEAEHILQMSGAVSDNDIVRLGNAAGANTIVFIGITGTGAMRRLQVRVLDVERRAPIMQSDAGERWQL